jgi:uncharacterized membrane protein YgcG
LTPPLQPKKKSKQKKKKTKKPSKKPQQQSSGSDVEDELTDDSGFTDDDDDALDGLTEADVDAELEALAATVEKQDAAAAKTRRRMKVLFDKSSRDSSSSTAMVTSADAAKRKRADDDAAKKKRADDFTAAELRAQRRESLKRVAGLLPSDSNLPIRSPSRVRFADDDPQRRLPRAAQSDPEDSASDDDVSLLEPRTNSSVIKTLASFVQYIAGCVLTHTPRRLPDLRDTAVALVYTAALMSVESLMRDRRPVQGAGFTFYDLIAVMERLQEFVKSLFSQNSAHKRDAMFALVNWTRDLKIQVDATVESCGSADLVNNQFGPFMNTSLSYVPAVFNPVTTARETFATLTQQFANRKGKQLMSALVAHPAPSASALTSPASAPTSQQPGGKGTGGGGRGGGRGGGKGPGGGKGSQPVAGPGPPGSFWHWNRNMYVRYFTDPATNRRDNRVCFLCGCGSTPGSVGHRADACQFANTPSAQAVQDWVERAIASK